MLNRIIINLFLTLAIIFIATSSAMAESVFLKDGSIVEGTIKKENDKRIKLELKNKLTIDIPRKRITRILYSNNYKKKVYIYKTDGKVIEGYVVGENRKFYIVRNKLDSPKEIKIPVNDVDGIMKSKFSSKKKVKKRLTAKEREAKRTQKRPADWKSNKRLKARYSPVLAGFVSIFPVWSGSFNDGFDSWGMGFVTLKSLSFIAGMLFGRYFAVEFSNDHGKYLQMADDYRSGGDLLNAAKYEGKADDAKKLEESFQNAAYGMLGVLAAAMIADIIYSSIKMSRNNKKYIALNNFDLETGIIGFDIRPRFGKDESNDVLSAYPEGIDIGVNYRF